MWLLSVGRGSRQALIVAGPHANEPVGGATVLRLAERALADPRSSDAADITWNLLLSLDPDGSRRNEGWLSGPYTLGHYFRHFFRPGFLEQPEWLPDGAAGAVLPETRALLDLQDELRPFLQCSLHGVDVGGGFVELTRELPGLDRRVAYAAARLGIPRELGPYDTLYWPRLGPAVYRIPPPRRGDLAAAITEAAVESTWYHPHRLRHGHRRRRGTHVGRDRRRGRLPVRRRRRRAARRQPRPAPRHPAPGGHPRPRPPLGERRPRRRPAPRPGRRLSTGRAGPRRLLGPRRPRRRRPAAAPARHRPTDRPAPSPAAGSPCAPPGCCTSW